MGILSPDIQHQLRVLSLLRVSVSVTYAPVRPDGFLPSNVPDPKVEAISCERLDVETLHRAAEMEI